ncbi:helix-turn-helix domain-containing protein [Saccharothrix obliqua]|uniref:helix-turn-helix domain-containing protein n=1 Tax=Saccharothrix obliqua TaxID=2861747 RepID=UPI001C5FF1D7|nr:helix-turn-helix transcriptional regulator [Saccharothrix obliqua]MBW4721243.1 helix-turn-helix domain-containing protein [Saccharothrix obliqua]
MGRTSPKSVALGAELRAARDNAGVTLRELAKRLGVDHSSLSRAESGERPPAPHVVLAILRALGVEGAERERIVDMSRVPDDAVWMAVAIPDLRSQLSALLSLEQVATGITDVSPLLVPGLVQTSGYARAVMRAGGVPPEDVEIRVATRLGRQDVLKRVDRVRYTAFIGVPALRAGIGGPEVMAEQLDHLVKVAEWPNVELHVIPEAVGWHPALEGAFMVLDTEALSVVHVENRRSGLFYQDVEDMAAYREAVDQLREIALDADETTQLIAREADRVKEFG